MMQTNTIVLVGMPGSGKTTVGKALASELGLPFADLDAILEAEEGCSIAQVFEQRGEGYFRQRESELLQHVLQTQLPLVLATGGGTPCYFHNIEHIRRTSFSIYLEVSWQQLAQRLTLQQAHRPLLAGMDRQDTWEVAAALQDKFSWRIPFYRQAHYHVAIEAGEGVGEVVAQIMQVLQEI